MLVQRNDHGDPGNTRSVRLWKRFVPTSKEFDGGKFFTIENGKKVATPLLMVLFLVEVTDIIFAVDSIPAIFAITDEPFIVFSSNAMAILGLRAMYFLLADLMHRFIYLKIGLSFVLIWVGFKMILGHSGIIKIDTNFSLLIIIAILASSIIASLAATRVAKSTNTDDSKIH
jgi:tellurite resistance protein TerC